MTDKRVELLKSKLKKELNIGSIAGLAGGLFLTIFYFAGLQPTGVFSLFGVCIPILMMIFGNQIIKKDIFQGQYSFGAAFQSSLTMSLVYSSLFAMLFYLLGVIIPEDLTLVIYERSIEEFDLIAKFASKTQQEGLDQEALDKHLELIKESSLSDLVWQEFSSKLFGGLILSAIAAVIFKSKR